MSPHPSLRRSRILESIRTYVLAVAVLPVLGSAVATVGVAQPALVRIRLVLTTQSPAADLMLDAGTIVNTLVLSDSHRVRVHATQNHLSFTRDAGSPDEVQVGLLVSGIQTGTRVRWRLTLGSLAPQTRLEVYNENERGRARLVDRFAAATRESIFESPSGLLLAGGPLRLGTGPKPIVMAFYYPWFQHPTWLSDRLQDKPLYQYSTEFPEEIAQSLGPARSAGLDGVIVSWGGDTDWNDRRLRYVLDEARRLGLKVSILVETLGATEGAPGTVKPVVADKMQRWLEKAFDSYTSHPAFLRLDGRPVAFVYVADTFTASEWREIVASLDRSRRSMRLIGDTLDPALLESFDGAFAYATAGLPRPGLGRLYADRALVTQSYDLLSGGRRRVAAATVTPGYDDSRLGRETSIVVDRADGMLYEAQWQAAVSAHPDWVLVTSWNEFWENTHIEPSARYGYRYAGRTRVWSDTFRRR